jgi:hypothetical protein
MLSDWDHSNVQWFDNYPALWNEYCEGKDPKDMALQVGAMLELKLGLPICTLTPEQSKFFKRHLNADKHNLGPLVTEMEVIRRIEGW